MTPPRPDEPPPLLDLVDEAQREARALFAAELDVFRARLAELGARAAAAVVPLVVALALLLAAVLVSSAAAVLALSAALGHRPALASGLVGVALALGAGLAARRARGSVDALERRARALSLPGAEVVAAVRAAASPSERERGATAPSGRTP
jgi:hypothetical protein